MSVSNIFHEHEQRLVGKDSSFVVVTGRDEEAISRLELAQRSVEINLHATFKHVADVSSYAPIRFDKFASEFNETDLSSLLFMNFEANSRGGRIPLQGFKIDPVRVHFDPSGWNNVTSSDDRGRRFTLVI